MKAFSDYKNMVVAFIRLAVSPISGVETSQYEQKRGWEFIMYAKNLTKKHVCATLKIDIVKDYSRKSLY